jgi:hypothetical protein
MIELQNDSLKISFPELHKDARCSINFMRTLRIPDDGREYPLPAGLGEFPLHHVEDFSASVPDSWNRRGGVLMPMYQAEALWLNFDGDYPMAIKIAAGKINAVSGEAWKDGLSGNPQDYLVLPDQPWLDGYHVEKDLIRQFVAMPLGQGYSVEEQITGKSEFGGLQIIACPMKREVYERMQSKQAAETDEVFYDMCCREGSAMGLAAGGLMRQQIYEDEYGIEVWDTEHASRCFIHLVNSEAYASITGHKPPHAPISKQEYAQHGIPWFDYYDDQTTLAGSKILSGVNSLSQIAKKKGEKIWGNDSVNIGSVKSLGGKKKSAVSEGSWSA